MLLKAGKLVKEEVIAIENGLIESVNNLLKEQEGLLEVDLAKNNENISNTFIITIAISLIAGFIGVFVAYLIANSMLRAVGRPKVLLDKLAVGEIPDSIEENANELLPIVQASNKLKAMLQEASKFSKEVGNSNFSYEFTPASRQDILGYSLLNMRGNLAELAEEER